MSDRPSTIEIILIIGAMAMVILQGIYLVVRVFLRKAKDDFQRNIASSSTPIPPTSPNVFPYGGSPRVAVSTDATPMPPRLGSSTTDTLRSRTSTDQMDVDEMGGMLSAGMQAQNPNRT